jgi:hypothetical protein
MSAMARPKKTNERKTLYKGWVCDSWDLQKALEAHSSKWRRSMQMTITILLEQALKVEGLWPPPTDKN